LRGLAIAPGSAIGVTDLSTLRLRSAINSKATCLPGRRRSKSRLSVTLKSIVMPGMLWSLIWPCVNVTSPLVRSTLRTVPTPECPVLSAQASGDVHSIVITAAIPNILFISISFIFSEGMYRLSRQKYFPPGLSTGLNRPYACRDKACNYCRLGCEPHLRSRFYFAGSSAMTVIAPFTLSAARS
jgi:hypothetical protein